MQNVVVVLSRLGRQSHVYGNEVSLTLHYLVLELRITCVQVFSVTYH
jgi:hypothetical protein